MTETENKIPDFYGKEVYSLSCIVGKNGTGKTSIVDFLRETFFKLIRVIDQLDQNSHFFLSVCTTWCLSVQSVII